MNLHILNLFMLYFISNLMGSNNFSLQVLLEYSGVWSRIGIECRQCVYRWQTANASPDKKVALWNPRSTEISSWSQDLKISSFKKETAKLVPRHFKTNFNILKVETMFSNNDLEPFIHMVESQLKSVNPQNMPSMCTETIGSNPTTNPLARVCNCTRKEERL